MMARPSRFENWCELPGAAGGVSFMKTFGKPDRLLTCECERSESTTLAQAFQMINGETVRNKLEMRCNRIGKWLDAGRSDSEILDLVYLAALARLPTETERTAVTTHNELVSSSSVLIAPKLRCTSAWEVANNLGSMPR